MRQRGRLTEWNDERGFGFVTSLDGQSRAFVHVSEFPREMRRPQPLDLLTYDTSHDDRGRLQAVGVEFLTHVARKDGRASRLDEIPVLVPFGVLAAVLLVSARVDSGTTLVFLFGYAVVSVLTFGAYAVDKSAARHGRFRTEESALHLLELLGGWPGALAAQRLLRHKTVKQSFQAAFWACVIVNVVALPFLVWLISSPLG